MRSLFFVASVTDGWEWGGSEMDIFRLETRPLGY